MIRTADRHLKFCGANLAAFKDHSSRELLLSGPAGSGKTLVSLAKLAAFCDDYPGARCLIVRKTRESLTESALVTWERDILGPQSPVLTKNPNLRKVRQSYKWLNDSEIVVAGIDKPGKVLSAEYDCIYVNEATDLTLEDWEFLQGRLRANAGPWDQIFGDCNPTTPEHWLYKRCQPPLSLCKLYQSKHYENPRYYDPVARKWTPAGHRYIGGRLQRYSGTRRARFLKGEWVAAEGLVYDGYRAEPDPKTGHPGHLRAAGWMPPPSWPRVWGIDWGESSPTVLSMWGVDPLRKSITLFREVYQTRLRPDTLGRWAAKQAMDDLRPEAIVCDIDERKQTEFEQAAREAGCSLVLRTADKRDRGEGITSVQSRFDLADDGQPLIFFVPDSLAQLADATLEEGSHPTSTLAELVQYKYDPKFLKDEPQAGGDHGMDVMRYVDRYVRTTFGGTDVYDADKNAPLPGGFRGYYDSPPGDSRSASW